MKLWQKRLEGNYEMGHPKAVAEEKDRSKDLPFQIRPPLSRIQGSSGIVLVYQSSARSLQPSL
jgi:hypothetical protein